MARQHQPGGALTGILGRGIPGTARCGRSVASGHRQVFGGPQPNATLYQTRWRRASISYGWELRVGAAAGRREKRGGVLRQRERIFPSGPPRPGADTELVFGPDVEAALQDGQPVVALESAIITHGMPWPANWETACTVEADVRAGGAVPATIALLEGRVHVGLSAAELRSLAQSAGSPQLAKIGRADLGVAQALGKTGGTTVAATAMVAARAGIPVFVTGGIGGVHRGFQQTLDISGDLQVLASAPVAVVCAGAKAILDLPATLEYLETMGVPVLGYRTRQFPAFYSASSGNPLEYSAEDPAQVAAVLRRHWRWSSAGVLVANPPPADCALPREYVEGLLDTALAEAAARGIRGKAVTPFLLDYLEKASGGRTLATNEALVRHNARLGAAIARAYAELLAAEGEP